jgi:hypothetical protein
LEIERIITDLDFCSVAQQSPTEKFGKIEIQKRKKK